MASNQATNKPRRSDKSKKSANGNEKSLVKKILNFILGLLFLIVFFALIGFISAHIIFSNLKDNTIEITDNNFWQNQSTSLIYDANGDQIGRLSARDVKWTPICKNVKKGTEIKANQKSQLCDSGQKAVVSPYYTNALIATEDQGFMDHHGVNWKGMFRVLGSAIVTQSTDGGGGSSITMQLAKLLYLQPVNMYDANGDRVTWSRGDYKVKQYAISNENKIKYKLSQMALALKIEDKYSKQEIMENYVNTMYFGSGGYGIKNAANYFYGVTPDKLTIAQSATLAGITNRPADWDPYKNPKAATKRRNVVIKRMQTEGYITAKQAKSARSKDIEADLVDHSGDGEKNDERLKYYNDVNFFVLDQLEDLLGENADLSTGGMKIHTTIDPQLQKHTIDVLDTDNGYVAPYEGTETGTAMIDSSDGGILAIGNGFDGESPYSYAYNELRNPGSTSKPVVDYAPAIEYLDWSTAHMINDKTTYYTNGPQVNNACNCYYGNLTMMKALSMSLNTPAVQTFQAVEKEIGQDGYKKWFENMGLYNWEAYDDTVYESYAIGAFGTTPVEMASAFATFSNGGTYYEPHVIDYIEFDKTSPYYDIYGKKWYPDYETHKAMKESTAYLITKMLNPDNDGSLTKDADVPDLDMAIKTGTSNWGPNDFGIPSNQTRDRWTIGYSPDITTAVWYGYEYEYEKQGYYMSVPPEQPLQIFKALMEETVTTDNPKLSDGEYEMPDNVVTKTVSGVQHYFIKDSDDDDNAVTTVSAPKVNVQISSDTISVSWNKVDGASEYNVTANGNIITTTNGTSASIKYSDLFATGCESTYAVGVQAVSSSGVKSGVNEVTINNDVSNCGGTTEEDAPAEEDTDTEDTPTEESTDDSDSGDKDSTEKDNSVDEAAADDSKDTSKDDSKDTSKDDSKDTSKDKSKDSEDKKSE